MHSRIFPSKDADFKNYTDTNTAYITTNATRLGISKNNVNKISGIQQNMVTNWAMYIDPAQRTKIVTATKTDLRKQAEKTFRSIFKDIPASVLTISDRKTFNLKAADTVRTRISVKENAPSATVESTEHVQHTLRFRDKTNPESRAMPEGQKIILQSFVGAADLPLANILFANDKNVTRSLTKISFTEAQVSQTCYYRCCYENTRGERGPWSDVISSVVS